MQKQEVEVFNFNFGESVHNHVPENGNYYKMEEYIDFMKSIEEDNSSVDTNTNLMLTKFRKIYYDSFGWNKLLIPETANIAPFPASYYTQKMQHSHEVVLSNNDLYDVAHIFAILDANNHNGPLTPVPESIIEKPEIWDKIKDIVPVVEDRLMASGWLGDLSEITGEFLLQHKITDHLLSKAKQHEKKQDIIDQFGAYYKNLANVDGMILAGNDSSNKYNGQTVSDIFESFYGNGTQTGERGQLKSSIYLRFGESIGLEGWDGSTFKNSEDWLNKQTKNLQTCTAFYFIKMKGLSLDIPAITQEKLKSDLENFVKNLKEEDIRQDFATYGLNILKDESKSLDQDLKTLITCFLIWNGWYKNILSIDTVLTSYLNGLSQAIIKTQKS
ncbi:hypothetical protein MSP8886_02459 [Marinomonas spartinae]|uniref:Uncharacterized protein n=1 Tax=Marinomonas spartinae TaxID=1792290 RepID=A0A1A8TH27_9GAMM|nr:hypothetical protein [Marinomonas spartinae]SBS32540.1 hypothetical protein MSP8886_02459 [Marinomonas spartinae]